jgi:hypothetical protein
MALPETMLNWKSHKQKQPWLSLLSKLGHLQRLDIFWTEFASVYVGHEHEK